MKQKIPRLLSLAENRRHGRVTALYGARRIGKTTLVNDYLDLEAQKGRKILRANSDDLRVETVLRSRDTKQLLDWVGDVDIVSIDEAQRVRDIGLGLKILIDVRPDLEIIATGSASFDLANKLGEPLTGRQTPLQMFPISVLEMKNVMNNFELASNLEDFLLYGMYPEARTAQDIAEKKFILNELINGYLLRDALQLEKVKSPKILLDLLTLLAYQIGKEVSHLELAGTLGIDRKTVARYLDILEKCFVLYNLRGFSRNLRSEVTKTSRYYFYDTGIRNALLGNFNEMKLRDDRGDIWENFFVIERLKARTYKGIFGNAYFWRTWEQQEIDLIEERDGKFFAYEVKWNPKRKTKVPSQWIDAYGEDGKIGTKSEFHLVTPSNFLDYL